VGSEFESSGAGEGELSYGGERGETALGNNLMGMVRDDGLAVLPYLELHCRHLEC
jgi:hypothetical protein